MTKLFIHLEVQDGERTHDHKILHQTNCEDLNFAAEYYVAHFWGHGKRDFKDNWWWYSGEFAAQLVDYDELSDNHYKILNKYI